MKEKILELLKTKFAGVSETTLSRMADKASKTATSEELAQTYVDGVNLQIVIESEADYRATKATQTSIENYEKKHNIKEGKPIQKPEEKTEEKTEKTDEAPSWAKQLMDFANIYSEEKKANAAKTAKEKLVSKIIELGANKDDKSHIESLVEISGVTAEDDIESKATAILGAYNVFKKPAKTTTPDKTDDDVADDAFADLLKAAKGEE